MNIVIKSDLLGVVLFSRRDSYDGSWRPTGADFRIVSSWVCPSQDIGSQYSDPKDHLGTRFEVQIVTKRLLVG